MTIEGDPLDLARKRTARFHDRKIVLTSSPTRPGVGIHADNTDGLGLVADITRNAGVPLQGARLLLCVAPLLSVTVRLTV